MNLCESCKLFKKKFELKNYITFLKYLLPILNIE